MTSSLIISTYNWPEALSLMLKSIMFQKVLPDEMIIADDGSNENTRSVIEVYAKKITIPLIHIWQEDDGFRKATILNKAIAKATGDYIIQVDGDCILHPSFIKDHINFVEKNVYLFGSRVNIQESFLKELFKRRKVNFHLFSKGIKKRTRALHAPLFSMFYKKNDLFSKKYRGCNTSFYKKDFIAINGYNENFEGWGREDSELALRFHNYGLKARRLRYRAILFHIFHNEKPKDRLELNNEIELNTIKNKVTWCENGIDSYLNEK
ncbi:glycosyltransferase [Flavobacteriaceae bacterium AU392]|nr:glycosyltransferase [Flavobacteriaceae bacterium]RKM82946.1 glycosyltransferase [Flavobacteriaceae bacterium AU392]